MNVQPPIVVSASNLNAVVLDVPNDAVPFGTLLFGFQLRGLLKSPDVGLRSQVASAAFAAPGANAVTATSAAIANNVDKTNLQRVRARDAGHVAGTGVKVFRTGRGHFAGMGKLHHTLVCRTRA